MLVKFDLLLVIASYFFLLNIIFPIMEWTNIQDLKQIKFPTTRIFISKISQHYKHRNNHVSLPWERGEKYVLLHLVAGTNFIAKS